MRSAPVSSSTPRAAAFTLIEVLIATLIFTILMASLNAVLFSAMKLRSKTMEMVEDDVPIELRPLGDQARFPRHFAAGGDAGGRFPGGEHRRGQRHAEPDRTLHHERIVGDTAPWGDVQRVSYYLRTPDETERKEGMQLVRAVTQNLVAYDTNSLEETYEEPLISGVRGLEFAFYNGTGWDVKWDTATETTCPWRFG